MEISEEKIKAAYEQADDKTKKVLASIFQIPVTERIRDFKDVIRELGNDHPFVQEYNMVVNAVGLDDSDLLCYLKMRMVCAALNEGWEPTLQVNKREFRFYPMYWLSNNGFGVTGRRDNAVVKMEGENGGWYTSTSFSSFTGANMTIGSHLCLKTEQLAKHAAKHFSGLWLSWMAGKRGGEG